MTQLKSAVLALFIVVLIFSAACVVRVVMERAWLAWQVLK